MKTHPDYDVIVAGCGPAGAWAIKHLPAGMRVLAVDAEDPLDLARKPKVCGGLLTAQAQALLPEIPEEIRAAPFHAGLEHHDLDNRKRGRFPVLYANCWRGKLDSWLLQMAFDEHKNVEYRPATRIFALKVEADSVRVQFEQGGEAMAGWLLDCSGWRQIARSYQHLPTAPFLHAFQAICGVSKPYSHFVAVFRAAWTPFFAWHIPKSSEECEIGAAFPSESRGSAKEMLAPVLEHFAGVGMRAEPKTYRGCRLTHPSAPRDFWLGHGRVLACGEAAGLVSPSSGDGISFALASGKAAAEALKDSSADVQARYKHALSPELAELKLNIAKAKQMSSPFMRRLGYSLLAAKYGRGYERLSL
jgi:flavin-dependent dehydrogenase